MRSHARTAVTAVFFTAVIIGFAYVMPAAVQRAARSVFFGADQSTTPVAESTPGGSGAVHLEGSQEDNHGQAVRVAARCAVEGRAHARLVRSIARDKEATAQSAEAACEEALARQASGANDLDSPNANRREDNAAGPDTTNTSNRSKGGTSKDGTSGGDSGSESDRTPEAEPPSEPPSEPTASPPPPAEDT
ncbi:MAG TPA: hypothetical protein VHJ82_07295, partial [Actinomycetota bacterium]|nr:hypothetical protein [Actinomycetota bacterium]